MTCTKLLAPHSNFAKNSHEWKIIMNIKIFQTFHKNYARNEECDWIQSIGVNGFKHENGVSDATNENISSLNPHYCELTAQYWAWKNSPAEFIGFYHYRRYLDYLPNRNNSSNYSVNIKNNPEYLLHLTSEMQLKKLKSLLEISSVVTPQKTTLLPSIAGQYTAVVDPRPWHAFITCLKLKYPNTIPIDTYFENISAGSICNIFVMRQDLFQRYCTDLFEIIDLVYAQIGSPFDSYNNRYPGFLSERFLGFWLQINRITPIEVPMVLVDADY